MSTSRPASSFSRKGSASGTRIRFRRVFFGKSPESISWRFPSIPSGAPPVTPMRSITGRPTPAPPPPRCGPPTSPPATGGGGAPASPATPHPPRRPAGPRGEQQVEEPLLAAARARSATFSISSARTMWTAISTRSRTIDSTSAPRPHSVNLEASTLRKGAWASFARRRAISVFPTPVGPAMMMFFGRSPPQFRGDLPSPPPVPQSDRDGPLGRGLADDVPVELRNDLPRDQRAGADPCRFRRHGAAISSTATFPFV